MNWIICFALIIYSIADKSFVGCFLSLIVLHRLAGSIFCRLTCFLSLTCCLLDSCVNSLDGAFSWKMLHWQYHDTSLRRIH